MTDSLRSSPLGLDDAGDSFAPEDDDYLLGDNGSGEETEDASESEMNTKKPDKEFTEIKEQMYQDKLTQLKKQLQQLQEGTLPEYLRRLKRIEQQYKERLRLNDAWKAYCVDNAEHCHDLEVNQNQRDFELKKASLRETLIASWEEKKRQVENDKLHMELTADFMDFKPITTRKLRRRANPDGTMSASSGTQEKKRKQSPTVCLLLDDAAINEDLKIINKVSGKSYHSRKPQHSHANDDQTSCDARIEDGKLYFEKRWYSRGQAIYVDSKETGKFGATICSIATAEVWIKKIADNGKMRMLLTQLQKGRYTIRRRST